MVIQNLFYHLYKLGIKKIITDYVTGILKISYSQQGEDLFILKYFNKSWGGTFIDVGAFHPKMYSNTYILSKLYGWKGMNIEPNPDNFKLFLKYRKNDINLNLGVYNKASVLDYYKMNAPALNSFDKEHAEKWNSINGFSIKEIIKINVKPLYVLLDENLKKGQTIDLLTIDVEGLDLEVLESNNWDKYRPKLVVVEDDKVLYQKESLIINFMKSKNYNLIAIFGISMFFEEIK